MVEDNKMLSSELLFRLFPKAKRKITEVSPLEWFLDFINADLDTLTLSENMKLAVEVKLALDGSIRWRVMSDYLLMHGSDSLISLFDPDLRTIKDLQAHLRIFFEGMTKKIEALRYYERNYAEQPLNGINEVAELTTNIKARARIITPGLEDFESEDDYSPPRFGGLLGSLLGPNVIRVQFSPDNNKDALIFHFLQDIDGLPLIAIRQCPECKKWFVHLSRREKEFCSNKCAAKKTSRQRYQRLKENDPESYQRELEEAQERAHKSYEKRQAPKLAPGAKVQRRPRKRARKED